jgi:hypothetical protein
VGATGQDILFGQQLDEVRERLVPWRPYPALKKRDHAPVDPLDDQGAHKEKAEAWEDK